MNRNALAASAGLALALSCVSHGDVINDWNSAYRDAIRVMGGGPGHISRIGAIMNVAMYDAVNSINTTHTQYRNRIGGYEQASMEAAIAQAAHRVLSATASLTPELQTQYDNLLASHLSSIGDANARNLGIALANQIADDMLPWCDTDGWDNEIKYTPGAAPGNWNPTFPNFSDPYGPHWGNVRPWTMDQGDQFRPPEAPALTSERYTQDFNQVKELGARNSATRTADQTEIAYFWANDMDGTFKPPGHLNYITQVVADDQNLSLQDKARLFAMVSVAMGDAAIVAWDAKYNTDMDLWRPIEGIRRADEDGNADTISDPTWEALAMYTPPFPAYTSGHATFAGVHAGVMAAFFGSDNISFTIGTDDPDAVGVFRTYDSFSAAAFDNAISRIYLGVHWWFDGEFGLESGYNLADWISANYFQLIPAPGATLALGGMLGVAALRRRR